MLRLTAASAAALLLTACVAPTSQSFDDAPIRASVSHPDRSDADRERDPTRRPVDVLTFFGVSPGQTVLDLYSGGGYYTEIAARTVGDRGVVHAHNNRAYLAFAKDEITARFAKDRLGNVQRLTAENNALDLTPGTYDTVLMVLTYHDLYYVDEKNGWPRIDGPALLAQLYAGLKPGAVLGVVDHAAVAGAPASVGGTLHRIDPQLALAEITAAGFVLEAQSDLLANPADDHTLPMYDPAIKGKTDRFIYRFRRP